MNLSIQSQSGTPPPHGTCPLLRVVALKKTYTTPQGPLAVLKGIDLSLGAGSSLALMGESGSGKSTLLHLIAALDEVDGGQIWLDDVLVTGLSETERATLRRETLGIVFQQLNLIPSLTVRARWSNQNIWMGHAAATSSAEHLFSQTFARGGIGQAGVAVAPFRAWIDDWSFASRDASPEAGLSRGTVAANGPNFRYTLNLTSSMPLVLHGEHGFSRKSERGQASYYYSQPFFTVDGVLILRDRKMRVSGQAWMDREWSSQPLASDQKGWDWFSLHLASGEKVMLFRLRSEKTRGFFAGTWIAADGTAQALGSDDIVLTPLSESTVAGRQISTHWKVKVKSRGLDIETTPLNADSWMATAVPYWEGPISFMGSHQGQGYLEMTGY